MKRRRSTTSERGFTLLELLVTLTIAGLLLAIGVPLLNDTVARARLRASAERIAATLRQVRTLAMKTAQPAQLSIDRAHQAYVAGGRAFVLPAGESLSLKPFGGSPQEPATLEFLPDGTANGGTIAVTGGSHSAWIDVDWLTGRVSVRD